MIMYYTILFLVIGLAIGSFLNVLIFRIDDLKSVISTRSHCQSCKRNIPWYDLIPFLSFILLKGRCRQCGAKISVQYPLVEIGVGLMFAFLYLMFGLNLTLIFYLIIFSLLTVIFVYDLKTQTVPEPFVWAALILAGLFGWYFGGFTFMNMIIGGLIAGGFLALLAFYSKEKWMGYGDIKIGLVLGFLTGYPESVFGLFFAFVLGSLVGLAFISLRRKSIKEAIPFAPFIIFSTLFTITYGQIIVNWYLFNYFIY